MSLLYERIGRREGLARLLRHFYADVRQDPVIGPIFNARIEHWGEHLAIIANFWETVLGATRTYSGPMPAMHATDRLPVLGNLESGRGAESGRASATSSVGASSLPAT